MLLRALFLRPARERPLRFLATVLGVAAGVAALVSTRVASRAAVGTLTEDVQALAGAARLEVVGDAGVPVSVLGALAPLASDVSPSPVVDEIVVCPALGDTLRVYGVDALRERADADARVAIVPSSGAGGLAGEAAEAATWLAVQRALDCRGAWISKGLADELGVAPGGKIELQVRARLVAIEVLGLFAPRAKTRAFDRVVLFDVACAQELLASPDRVTRVELVPRVEQDLTELARRARALLPPDVRVQEPAARADEARSLARSLEFHLDVMALISLVVGGVLVAISLATSVVQRREVLAVLVSLGASRAALARTLATEALVVGLGGGVLGTLGGWAASLLAAGGVRATLATTVGQAPAAAVDPRASDLAFGLALGAASALVAALLPILEARRTPPVQNLRRERPTGASARSRTISIACALATVALAPVLASLPPASIGSELPLPALAAAFLLQAGLFFVLGPAFEIVGHAGARVPLPARVGTLARLALSALSAGRRRAVWAAGAVAVAVGLSIAIATVVGSFRETIVAWSEHAFTADFWIRPQPTSLGGVLGRLDPEIVELARREFGERALDPFYVNDARYRGATVGLNGAEFGVVKERGVMAFVDGREPRDVFAEAHERGELLVNQAFGLRFGVEAGDTIRFETGGKELEKRVAGVFVDYGDSRGQIVIDNREYRAIFPSDQPWQVALFLPADVNRADARRRFVAALPADARIEMISVAELRGRMLEIFERTFAITHGMEAVAAAVAVIAVLTVLFALVSERRVEVGILRALGGSATQVGTSIAVQAGLLGLIGAVSGAAVGLAVGWILVAVVQEQSFRWTLDLHLPWSAVIETVAGVTIVSSCAGLWPGLLAARWTPRELLREDG